MVAAAALIFTGLAAHAQTGTLAEVKVTGSERFPGEQIAAMIGLAPGDPVTRDDLQAAADRLAQLGPFLSVEYRFRSRGLDVEVEFQVKDAPTVPVSFDNFPWFTDAELNAALEAEIPFYDGTAPEQGTILDLMSGILEDVLPSRGVTATVERALIRSPGGEGPSDKGMMMQFRVAGASLPVKGVEFSDPFAGSDKRVRQRLDDVVGKSYSRFAVDMFLQEQVRPVYLEAGHLEVHFGKPKALFTGNPNRPLENSVLVRIPVEPGPVYKWNGAQWTGNAAFGPAALNGYLRITLGEVADGNKIMAAIEHVRQEYWRRGFLDLKIEALPEFDEAASKVTYRMRVSEGPQYRLGEMVITGLSLAAERKLLAAWRIPQGEIFDKMYFEDFVENGVKPAFGDLPVHFDQLGRWLRTHPETKTVDVLLDFK